MLPLAPQEQSPRHVHRAPDNAPLLQGAREITDKRGQILQGVGIAGLLVQAQALPEFVLTQAILSLDGQAVGPAVRFQVPVEIRKLLL